MITGLGIGVGMALGLIVIPIGILLGLCAIYALFLILYYALIAIAYFPKKLFEYINDKRIDEALKEGRDV